MHHCDPSICEQDVTSLVNTHYNLTGSVTQLPGYIDLNFLLKQADGTHYIIKIANQAEPKLELEMQNAAMAHLHNNPVDAIAFPRAFANVNGDAITTITWQSTTRYMRLLSFVPGVFYCEHPKINENHHKQLGRALAHLSIQFESFNHIGCERIFDWDLKHALRTIEHKINYIDGEHKKQQIHQIRDLFNHQVQPFVEQLPQAVIHNDVNDYNLLLSSDDASARICGLIDFGDMVKTYQICELAIASTYAMLDSDDPLSILKTMTRAYHQVRSLTPTEAWVLFPLVLARLAMSVCNSAQSHRDDPNNDYLLVSAQPAWRAIDTLLSYDAKTIAFELQRVCELTPTKNPAHDEILRKRADQLFQTLSVSYQSPLLIERGQGQYLLDENNIAYLDMVNNVCHVGHCHSKVVEAGQQQMAKLNTNTRYLHQNIIKYSDALLDTFPDELSVVMFVNSGSEANELAMRLMHCYTQSDELIVVDGAYHGNTNKAIEISPYKFNGPGGEGPQPHIHTVPMPDPYRGEFKGLQHSSGVQYGQSVIDKLAQLKRENKQIGGFICESLQGVGGNLVMPDGYLETVYHAIREAGGVCIADEVQVGFGRIGKHWWGFESQGVVPDIVTLGKPIGNGHPMAAVVTTKAIAEAFVTGMEYFNTFGGNPVSCAIGLAVLETIKSEQLRENADATGQLLMMQLRDLQSHYPIIGDVRGLGLFVGVELILDTQLTPATKHAKQLIELLKSRHILLSLDGPHNNVLKIKPPIVFNQRNVTYFVAQLRDCLDQLNYQQ